MSTRRLSKILTGIITSIITTIGYISVEFVTLRNERNPATTLQVSNICCVGEFQKSKLNQTKCMFYSHNWCEMSYLAVANLNLPQIRVKTYSESNKNREGGKSRLLSRFHSGLSHNDCILQMNDNRVNVGLLLLVGYVQYWSHYQDKTTFTKM
jgi:hypothetical protein